MDLDAVKTFVTVVDEGQFRRAGERLALTQQAVSKRIATLERALGVSLFLRSPRGAQLSLDGRVFLPHARDLLATAERAAASVRPGRRALRVDVVASRLPPAQLVHAFYRMHPDIELEVVTHLFDADSAVAAVHAGTIDATIRAATGPLPDGVTATPVLDEALQLLTGPGHALADVEHLTPAALSGHRIWMPGNATGTEWTVYYDALATEFALTVDTIGPNFGLDALLEVLADSSDLATFVGEHMQIVWPEHFDLRRTPLRDPTPVYPHALIWRADNPHPRLSTLREHLTAAYHHNPRDWRPPRSR